MNFREYDTPQIHGIIKSARRELNRRKRLQKSIRRKNNHPPPLSSLPKNIEAFSLNSSELRAIPAISKKIGARTQYLMPLLCQDWSFLYPRSSEFGDFYVYAHVQPYGPKFSVLREFGGDFGGMPFYIGKGKGRRAYNLKRNEGHGVRLRKLLNDGFSPDDIVHIAFDGLSEGRALEIEAKLIYFFGTVFQKDRKNTFLVNLDVPKTPDFLVPMMGMKSGSSKENRAVKKEAAAILGQDSEGMEGSQCRAG